MGALSSGQSVGSWESNAGAANITVKQEIGKGHASQEAAAKAAFGHEAVITQESDGKFHAYTIDDGAYMDDLDLGETVSLKSGIPNVKVLDLIGDDNYQLKAERKVFPPLATDNGKVVYFMRSTFKSKDFGLGETVNNLGYAGANPEERWNEEIKQARKKGYTVILDPDVNKLEMQEALYDSRTAGLVFFGHGNKGLVAVRSGDRKTAFSPSDVDPSRVSKHLKFVYWQSCSTNSAKADWEKALNGAESVGWDRTVTAAEVMSANDPLLYGAIGKGLQLAGSKNGGRLDTLIDKHL